MSEHIRKTRQSLASATPSQKKVAYLGSEESVFTPPALGVVQSDSPIRQRKNTQHPNSSPLNGRKQKQGSTENINEPIAEVLSPKRTKRTKNSHASSPLVAAKSSSSQQTKSSEDHKESNINAEEMEIVQEEQINEVVSEKIETSSAQQDHSLGVDHTSDNDEPERLVTKKRSRKSITPSKRMEKAMSSHRIATKKSASVSLMEEDEPEEIPVKRSIYEKVDLKPRKSMSDSPASEKRHSSSKHKSTHKRTQLPPQSDDEDSDDDEEVDPRPRKRQKLKEDSSESQKVLTKESGKQKTKLFDGYIESPRKVIYSPSPAELTKIVSSPKPVFSPGGYVEPIDSVRQISSSPNFGSNRAAEYVANPVSSPYRLQMPNDFRRSQSDSPRHTADIHNDFISQSPSFSTGDLFGANPNLNSPISVRSPTSFLSPNDHLPSWSQQHIRTSSRRNLISHPPLSPSVGPKIPQDMPQPIFEEPKKKKVHPIIAALMGALKNLLFGAVVILLVACIAWLFVGGDIIGIWSHDLDKIHADCVYQLTYHLRVRKGEHKCGVVESPYCTIPELTNIIESLYPHKKYGVNTDKVLQMLTENKQEIYQIANSSYIYYIGNEPILSWSCSLYESFRTFLWEFGPFILLILAAFGAVAYFILRQKRKKQNQQLAHNLASKVIAKLIEKSQQGGEAQYVPKDYMQADFAVTAAEKKVWREVEDIVTSTARVKTGPHLVGGEQLVTWSWII